jgi:hypothetical protein
MLTLASFCTVYSIAVKHPTSTILPIGIMSKDLLLGLNDFGQYWRCSVEVCDGDGWFHLLWSCVELDLKSTCGQVLSGNNLENDQKSIENRKLKIFCEILHYDGNSVLVSTWLVMDPLLDNIKNLLCVIVGTIFIGPWDGTFLYIFLSTSFISLINNLIYSIFIINMYETISRSLS